ncbi:MAG: HEPN domain-containing protein [Nitrospirae bacterium]|nr:HEPN domain-containing protein [Nitrospirota bacterium]
MKPLTREWIEKAEGDFATAGREIRARKRPNYDAVCFHAQQCSEKFLKAILQEQDIPFGKTHNLIILLELIIPAQPSLELLRPSLEILTGFGVHVRYPGESADKATAREALTHCRVIRFEARRLLGLEEE